MPYSDKSNIEWFKWALEILQPKTVLDVGAGAGKYGSLVKELLPNAQVDAVEIWAPYIKEFELEKIYNKVYICDATIFPNYKYDLVIFGDVLEHMSKMDAMYVWSRAQSEAKSALISIPIIHFPQGESHGNPYEEHVEDHWTHEDILNTFSGITGYRQFQVTGTYLAEFTK
jgi:SAM-dependent methyltransferase